MKNNDALIRFRNQVAKLWGAGTFWLLPGPDSRCICQGLRVVLDGRDPYDGEQRP